MHIYVCIYILYIYIYLIVWLLGGEHPQNFGAEQDGTRVLTHSHIMVYFLFDQFGKISPDPHFQADTYHKPALVCSRGPVHKGA